jgi:hypothetical protein
MRRTASDSQRRFAEIGQHDEFAPAVAPAVCLGDRAEPALGIVEIAKAGITVHIAHRLQLRGDRLRKRGLGAVQRPFADQQATGGFEPTADLRIQVVLASRVSIAHMWRMAYRVTRASLEAAVIHLMRYGDTDIFPHLPELAFFADEQAQIVNELSKLDLDSYTPAGAIEALAPKARYSFRIAHQLSALDTVLLLACVIDIGDKIEVKRQSVRNFST